MGINYYAYIQSDEWRQRADAAKQRAGFRCQVCNRSSVQVTLDAHHRTYERLGNERPEDITVLCRDCHGLYELNKKMPRAPQYTPVTIEPNQRQQKTSIPAHPSPFNYQAMQTASNYAVKQDEVKKRLDRDKPWKIVIVTGVFAWVAIIWWIITWSPPTTPNPASARIDSTVTIATPVKTGVATEESLKKIQVIVKQEAKLFTGPGAGHAVLITLAKGAKVVISGYTVCGSGTWYQIGKDRWIVSEAVGTMPIQVPYVDGKCLPPPTKQESTPTPIPQTATAARTEATAEAYSTASRGANIRRGPGTGYSVVKTVVKGAKLTITGYTICNPDIWYRVGPGQWIAGFLVDGSQLDVSYVEIECKFTVSSTPTPVAPTSADRLNEEEEDYRQSVATEIAEYLKESEVAAEQWENDMATIEAEEVISPNCFGGCTEYPEWCTPPIKGNISYNTGEKIYHVPGQEYYNDTIIDLSDGERWFCTEQEAQAAGWRRSRR